MDCTGKITYWNGWLVMMTSALGLTVMVCLSYVSPSADMAMMSMCWWWWWLSDVCFCDDDADIMCACWRSSDKHVLMMMISDVCLYDDDADVVCALFDVYCCSLMYWCMLGWTCIYVGMMGSVCAVLMQCYCATNWYGWAWVAWSIGSPAMMSREIKLKLRCMLNLNLQKIC